MVEKVMKETRQDPAEIGQEYFYGDGRRKSYSKAFPHLLKAARLGEPHCQNLVGYCYDLGLGIEQDHFLAKKWYTKAASNDDLEGTFNLAVLYDTGKLGREYPKRAFIV